MKQSDLGKSLDPYQPVGFVLPRVERFYQSSATGSEEEEKITKPPIYGRAQINQLGNFGRALINQLSNLGAPLSIS
jgi:hypothetical protein